ncbi:MAG: hypothetical protein QMB00_07315, partial [Candidatus Nanopelagicales bacterium]
NIFGLSTVGVSLEEMAMTAVGLLTRRMDDTEREVQRVTMQPVLTLRSTHGRPRALEEETH